jgi:predicted nucleic acid-binding protein
MRFLDANVFIYAYYKPRRPLTQSERTAKEKAKEILAAVSNGEEMVLTTVVHLSEVANILKRSLGLPGLNSLMLTILMMDSVHVEAVRPDTYMSSVELGSELGLDPNDALAVETMQAKGVHEIYSFDRDFEGVKGIKRLP